MYIKVTVTPEAPKDRVVCKNGRYHIATKEPASQGRATEGAKILLAEYLDIPPQKLYLVKGAFEPNKIFIKRD